MLLTWLIRTCGRDHDSRDHAGRGHDGRDHDSRQQHNAERAILHLLQQGACYPVGGWIMPCLACFDWVLLGHAKSCSMLADTCTQLPAEAVLNHTVLNLPGPSCNHTRQLM